MSKSVSLSPRPDTLADTVYPLHPAAKVAIALVVSAMVTLVFLAMTWFAGLLVLMTPWFSILAGTLLGSAAGQAL